MNVAVGALEVSLRDVDEVASDDAPHDCLDIALTTFKGVMVLSEFVPHLIVKLLGLFQVFLLDFATLQHCLLLKHISDENVD